MSVGRSNHLKIVEGHRRGTAQQTPRDGHRRDRRAAQLQIEEPVVDRADVDRGAAGGGVASTARTGQVWSPAEESDDRR